MNTAGRPDWRWTFARPQRALALGLGSGLSPWAPGTAGTAAAVPLYLLLAPLPGVLYLAIVLALTLLGILWCGRAARDLGVHDHPAIVWDEVVGFLITMALAPEGWAWILLGFVLFRAFDILKPWPCRQIDASVQGGAGIVLDDVIAGIYAWLVIQAVALALHLPGPA